MGQPPLLPTPPVPPGAPRAPGRLKSEWQKFIASFGYAFSGLGYALRTQRNMRVHVVIGILAIIMGIVLHISTVEFAMIFVAITGVFIAEMFNTVMELCINLSTPEYNPLAKIAKDIAAGAVLLNAILAIIIGLFVFGPHLWALISL
jgi:diacylglycerol kinase